MPTRCWRKKITNNAEHQQLALKAAHEAIILLKNQNNFLPLERVSTSASR